MINFQLKNFVEENIPEFRSENSEHLIKAEKLLKAEARLNGTFTVNEIEDFLNFYKNSNANFDHILKIDAIREIYNNQIPTNLSKNPDLLGISEAEFESFSVIFSKKLQNFLEEMVRKNLWQNLRYFYGHYRSFFDVESLDYFKMLLHEKCALVSDGLYHFDKFSDFRKNYPFATDKKFYELLSFVDAYEFEEDVMEINSVVADRQITGASNKLVLGEILIAINTFIPVDPYYKSVLNDNLKVAKEWKEQKNGFLNSITYSTAKFFTETNNKIFATVIATIIIILFLLSFPFMYGKYGINPLLIYTGCVAITLYIYRNNAKMYFNFLQPKNASDYLLKYGGSLAVIMVYGFPLMILLGGGIGYAVSSIQQGKFPGQLVIVAILLAVKFFMNRK